MVLTNSAMDLARVSTHLCPSEGQDPFRGSGRAEPGETIPQKLQELHKIAVKPASIGDAMIRGFHIVGRGHAHEPLFIIVTKLLNVVHLHQHRQNGVQSGFGERY